MAQFVEAIPHLLLRIFAPALGVILATWLIFLFIPFVRKQVRPVFAVSEGHGRRVPPVQWVVLFSVMVACTLFSGKNTNGVQGVGGPLLQFNPPLVLTVTPEDITNGWRVTEETESESFAQPSAHAITNEPWRRRGAFDDAFRIPANGWSYPYATGVTVLARGELRTSIRTRDFPPAFAQGLSLLPLVNWPQLPEGRSESVFWYDATPSNTLLTTWWNAALGRNATNPVNFQAELFPDGGFTYRYEDRTVRHARVWPFDWDGDGLENTVDPDPLTPGPDAHGTNAEWYNTVCSNVLEAVATSYDPTGGGTRSCASAELSWREGVNSNAYYFVDVVTERGPAPIYFTGDRDSRLGNPVVVARAFETNRVPLLIGIDYAITSPVPFAVSYPMDYMYPELETNELCRAYIRWPLNFVFTEDIGASNRVYTVTVEPYDPGGVLEWGDSGSGVPMRGGPSGGGCNCVSYGVNSAWFSCSSTCTCESGCSAHGSYLLEAASFSVDGGECRCGFDDPPSDDSTTSSHEPTDPPSLTITFSKQAVLFEDEYEDAPGVTKPRRSTRVRLTIDAYGGAQGGTLWITGMNMDKLIAIDGDVTLPYSREIHANTAYHASSVYEGVSASVSVNDVTVNGSLLLNGQSTQIDSLAQLTSMKIELQTVREAPSNPSMHRHVHGIGEMVLLNYHPSGNVSLDLVDANESGTGSSRLITWGISNVQHQLTIRLADARYVPMISVLTPNGIEGQRVQSQTFGLPAGVAGGLALVQRYRVHPLNVSFEGLSIEEVPCDEEIPPEGYFVYTATNVFHRSHTRAAKAGVWVTVSSGNILGGPDSFDKAGFAGSLQRRTPEGVPTDDPTYGWCTGGSLTWKIPFGWNKHPHSLSADPVERFAEETRQVFRISANGDFRMEKLGHYAERKIDGRVFVDDHEDDGILNNN